MKQNFNVTTAKSVSTADDKSTLEQISKLLELHGYETQDLIHQYYLERYNEQQAKEDSDLGKLTVKCNFKDNILEVNNSIQ